MEDENNIPLGKQLKDIMQRSDVIRRACEGLALSLPRTPIHAKESQWPELQSQFANLSSKLKDLDNLVGEEFQHYVVSPTETARDDQGMPTTVIPQMLSTKRTPEKEKTDEAHRKRARMQYQQAKIGATETTDDGPPPDPSERLTELENMCKTYNEALNETVSFFTRLEANVMTNAEASVRKFSSSTTRQKPVDGKFMFAFMESGNSKGVETKSSSQSISFMI